MAYRTSEEHPFLGKEIHEQREFSEHTAQVIDEEVARILHAASDKADKLLAQERKQLDAIADALCSEEEIDEADLEKLIGPSINKRAEANGRPAIEISPGEGEDQTGRRTGV